VTVIGGGTGSFTILSGLVGYENLDIRSIITMMDSGGDSGRLRDEFGVLPPGDARRCLVALSEQTELLRSLFTFRFNEPPLSGRNFGNLFFLALTRLLGSERLALEAAAKILNVRGQVIPVTWDHAHLFAALADGQVVAGEVNIDVPKHDAAIPIDRVYLEPRATANPDALAAIEGSDFIVLAPGDLYTSTIANLLVDGVPDCLRNASAPLVYVLNLMTKHGETHGYAASRHVAEIARYAGRVPDALIVHEGRIPEDVALKYEGEVAHRVPVDGPALSELGVGTVVYADIMSSSSLVRHDPRRTAAALMDLFVRLAPSQVSTSRTRSAAPECMVLDSWQPSAPVARRPP
jgi:uncharacterized cofD-like protein